MNTRATAIELVMGRFRLNAVDAGDFLDKLAAERGVPVDQVAQEMVAKAVKDQVLMQGAW
jgi:hypothetical protein